MATGAASIIRCCPAKRENRHWAGSTSAHQQQQDDEGDGGDDGPRQRDPRPRLEGAAQVEAIEVAVRRGARGQCGGGAYGGKGSVEGSRRQGRNNAHWHTQQGVARSSRWQQQQAAAHK